MISSAPPDFWVQVVNRVAELIWQRETGNSSSAPYVSGPVISRGSISTFTVDNLQQKRSES